MELIAQHAKKIMEGCKERARSAGLRFEDESLEYIVTNRDLLELSPKLMIPTLYDYWVHDVEVLKEKGRYELYPGNPYETVINTRPAISFYNDNNPDWLNVMIFYHVLAHIDFFQNNFYYRHTWDYDFTGKALSDKRMISRLRSEKGRWVDYTIEFARGIDNLVGYHEEVSRLGARQPSVGEIKLDYYFDVFLQVEKKVSHLDYIKEIERYNRCVAEDRNTALKAFFAEITIRHPEFDSLFEKSQQEKVKPPVDLLQFIGDHSPFLSKSKNAWMKPILHVIRDTSLFFQPQIRTKIMNEGWASYWHETLFLQDDRIRGHEVDYARVNAGVTAMPRVGLNPYALGMRLFYYLEEMGDRGKYSMEYRRLTNLREREAFDRGTGQGKAFIFRVRETLSDFLFVNNFVDQEFVDRYKLFVAGRRLVKERAVWEYYVKSKKASDYRNMIVDSLYHPPCIDIDMAKCNGTLYLNHKFEGKPLVTDFIANTMMGIEYLWGEPVQLETTELVSDAPAGQPVYPFMPAPAKEAETVPSKRWQRVIYTMKDRQLTKKNVS